MGNAGDPIQVIVIESQSVAAQAGHGPNPAIAIIRGRDHIVRARQRAIGRPEITVGIIGVGDGFILWIGRSEELPARVVGVGGRLACCVGPGQRPVVRVVGHPGEQLVVPDPGLADFKQVNAVGVVGVAERASDRINRVGQVTQTVISASVELGLPIIEHAAHVGGQVIVADEYGTETEGALARVVVPNPTLERFLGAFQNPRRGSPVGRVQPVVELRFGVIAVGRCARRPAPVISVAKI